MFSNIRRLSFQTLALLLSACFVAPLREPLPAPLGKIAISAVAGANRDQATQLDLVFFFDPGIFPALPRTGPEWFRNKNAILMTHRTGIEVVSLEIPPLTTINPVSLPKRSFRSRKVLVYANYLSPRGQPAIDITGKSEIMLRLDAEAIFLAPVPPDK